MMFLTTRDEKRLFGTSHVLHAGFVPSFNSAPAILYRLTWSLIAQRMGFRVLAYSDDFCSLQL